MKRKFITLAVSIAVSVCGVALLLAGMSSHLPQALAHSITVDAGTGDWTMAAPTQGNLGHIGRNGSNQGEYVWNDVTGDERTNFSNPDPRVDLAEFRVTADTTNLYFLAVMNDIDQASGNGAPMVQIAIDTDRQNGSGEIYFAGFADTQVGADAQWEYLLTSRFGSGHSDVRVYTATATGSNWNAFYTGTAVISDVAETIEMAVPWAALGFSGPPTLPLRFTVAVFRADVADHTWDISGSSDALDCVTNYGDPGDTTSNTWAEVGDGVVDYYFDLFFESDGDVYPPLLVSEYQPNPPGDDADREWVEIYNNTPFTLSLNGFKVGDEETIGGGEGMFQFPDGYTIGPGKVVVVANRADDTGQPDGFYYLYGFYPDFEIVDTQASVPNMSRYSTWASNTAMYLSNNDDEALLVDPSDTIIDVAGHTNGGYTPYPGVTYLSWSSSSSSIERRPVYQDTNDCSVDFRLQSNPTPDQVSPDVVISKTGPTLVIPGDLITFTIAYSNAGVQDAADVVIADTLPDGVSYVTDTSGLACPACTPGATGLLTWSVGTLTPTHFYSFTLLGSVASTVPYGSLLTNTVAITTTSAEVTTTNNLDQWGFNISPLDLVVTKFGPRYGVLGEQIVYSITVENRGIQNAANVILTDTLPAGATFVSQTNNFGAPCPACVPGATGVLTWNVGLMIPNSTFILDLTISPPSTATVGTVLTNTAEASTSTLGDNPANNTDFLATTLYPLVSIHDIQYVDDPATGDASPYNGRTVWVEGVVVAGTGEIGYSGNNFVIEDPAGGPWSGLMVYNGGAFPNVVEGDYVRLLGQVDEYHGMTELKIDAAPHALEVVSTTNPLPAPAVITTGAFINAATAEQWESVLIEFQGATVTDPDLGYGEWAFDDGTGATRADDFGENDGDLTYTPALNDYYRFIRGIGWYSYGDYKLEPRYDADIDLDYPLTFIYHDLEDVVHSGEAVYLAGSFNSWSPTATLMSANADSSVFSVTVILPTTGTYEYKYVVYTDTTPSGPPNWNWLQSQNRSVVVTVPTTTHDYRNIEPGYLVLQWPHAITTTVGTSTGNIYGQIWADDLTSRPGEPRAILAQVGYGTDSDPANWTTWASMVWNRQDGNNDEFVGVLTPTARGVYSYVVRFNGNWGAGNPNDRWYYGDKDGVHPGDPFEIENAGVLTVTAPDLSGSKAVTPTADVRPGDLLTYTITLINGSDPTVITASVTLTDALPTEVKVITSTLPTGMTYLSGTHTLHWTGDVAPGKTLTLSFQVQVLPVGTLPPGTHVFTNTVQAQDGYGTTLNFSSASVTVAAHRIYLPLVARGWSP